MSRPETMRCLLWIGLLLLAGCKSAPAPSSPHVEAAAAYPARPSVVPPAFKVVHQDDDTLTLVAPENATDDEISAMLWELHDAFVTHGFDALKLPQKFIDARQPKVWFHIYRGAKCANEKYATGAYPCGASYHGAGDYTVGSYKDPKYEEAVLHTANGQETRLWDPDKAVPAR